MATRLILIRHGETDDNLAGRLAGWRESELTERGRSQARLVADYVATNDHPNAVYASPLRRAQETARALAQRLHLTVQSHPGLRELSFGDAEGLTLAELHERFAHVLARTENEDDVDAGWPGGETRREFYRRVQDAVAEIVAGHPEETVAIVTHGGVISSFLAHIAEGKATRWRQYQVANCSIAEVVVDAGNHNITRWNHVDHLSDVSDEDAASESDPGTVKRA